MPDKFPLLIRSGSVVVRIVRVRASSTRAGWTHVVSWVGPRGRERHGETNLAEAKRWAGQKAAELAAGLQAGADRGDLIELAEARRMAGATGVLAALAEWQVLKAKADPVREVLSFDEAVRRFVGSREMLGRSTAAAGTLLRTLGPHLPARPIADLTPADWERALGRFSPATRNTYRRNLITLCRWLRRQDLLPADRVTAAERTERAKEPPVRIEVLTPDQFRALLQWTRRAKPEMLGAVVLGGFCGLRIGELRRQVWEDVHVDRKFLSVTAAKHNTPSHRLVEIPPAALQWLSICRQKAGKVCPVSVPYLRWLARQEGLPWPRNALRHSFITYSIALTGDKPRTATQAGNSVEQIDKHYRVPRPRAEGTAWFRIRPEK